MPILPVLCSALLVAVAAGQNAGNSTFPVLDWSVIRPNMVQVPGIESFRRGLSPRIVGGREATRGQFPYQAALFMDSRSFCGGSLVTTTLVLTAAHCNHGFRTVLVYLGAHNIQGQFEASRQVYSSAQHTAHPSYNPRDRLVDFDIAVVRLPTPAQLTPSVGLVRLPSISPTPDDYVGHRARVSGWGVVADGTTTVNPTLKFVDLAVMTNAQCIRTYGQRAIKPAKLCASSTSTGGTSGPCNGDSGGPLVIQEADRKFTQVGIVSFGSARGCSTGSPAVFTRVTSYLDNFLAEHLRT